MKRWASKRLGLKATKSEPERKSTDTQDAAKDAESASKLFRRQRRAASVAGDAGAARETLPSLTGREPVCPPGQSPEGRGSSEGAQASQGTIAPLAVAIAAESEPASSESPFLPTRAATVASGARGEAAQSPIYATVDKKLKLRSESTRSEGGEHGSLQQSQLRGRPKSRRSQTSADVPAPAGDAAPQSAAHSTARKITRQRGLSSSAMPEIAEDETEQSGPTVLKRSPTHRPTKTAGEDPYTEDLLLEGERVWVRALDQRTSGYFATSSNLAVIADDSGTAHIAVCGRTDAGTPDTYSMKVIVDSALYCTTTLHDQPRASIGFMSKERGLNIVVAMTDRLEVFKGAQPVIKHSLPSAPLSEAEARLWAAGRAEECTPTDVWFALKDLVQREGVYSMSASALHYLTTAAEDIEYQKQKLSTGRRPQVKDTVCCMCICNRDLVNRVEPFIIFGTDSGSVFLLDSATFLSRWEVRINGRPMQIETTGNIKESSFKVVVACREKRIVFLRRDGNIKRASMISLDQPCVAFCTSGENLIVGLSNKQLAVYSGHGRPISTADLRASIMAMEKITLEGMADGFAVALLNCMVYIFVLDINTKKLSLCHAVCMNPTSPVAALKFGKYGRMRRCLIGLMANGSFHCLSMERGKRLEPKFGAALQPKALAMRKVKVASVSKAELHRMMTEDKLLAYHRYHANNAQMQQRTAQNYYKLATGSLYTTEETTKTQQEKQKQFAQQKQLKRQATEAKNPAARPGMALSSDLIGVRTSIRGVGPRLFVEICVTNRTDELLQNILVTMKADPSKCRCQPPYHRLALVIPSNDGDGGLEGRLTFTVDAIGTIDTAEPELTACIFQEVEVNAPMRLLAVDEIKLPVVDGTEDPQPGTAFGPPSTVSAPPDTASAALWTVASRYCPATGVPSAAANPAAMGVPTRPATGTAVTRPATGTALTRPATGTAVTRPATGTAVTRPATGTALTRPATGTAVAQKAPIGSRPRKGVVGPLPSMAVPSLYPTTGPPGNTSRQASLARPRPATTSSQPLASAAAPPKPGAQPAGQATPEAPTAGRTSMQRRTTPVLERPLCSRHLRSSEDPQLL